MKLGLLLIALGFGYRVYADASREKGNLRSLGLWIGALIMAISFIATTFLIYRCSSYCVSGKKFGCPFKSRMPAISQTK